MRNGGRWIPLAILFIGLAGAGCRGGHTPGGPEHARAKTESPVRSTPGGPSGERVTGTPGGTSTGTGVLRGRVLLTGPRPQPRKTLVVKDAAVCGVIDHFDDRLLVDDEGGVMNAVVSIPGVRGGKGMASMGESFVLDQKACAYHPHVLLVPVGGTVKILNGDGVLHNIHTYSTLNPAFNVAQPKILKEIKKTFTKPEKIAVRCDVHGWMSSWVIVVDQPYNVVTDEHGRFELTGIPPGRYSVECWQETLGTVTAEVTVGGDAGGTHHDFVYEGSPNLSGMR